MIRKTFIFILLIFYQFIFTNLSFSKVDIVVSVNDEIISSFDLVKESNYLKIINPNLNDVDDITLTGLAKQSLINEIVKKIEVSKFIELSEENEFANKYFKEVVAKLGYENEIEFSNKLIRHNSYTLEEIKLKNKIEIYWNDLIFNKFNNQIKINTDKLKKKINLFANNKKEEIFLSEIVIEKDKDKQKNKQLIDEIKSSININGFNNTASIYSISQSSKVGGKIGWFEKNTLSEKIYENVKNLKKNEISNFIDFDNNLLIVKIEDIRNTKQKIDKDNELQKLILFEKNKRLENFSRMYFNRIKVNYFINEK